MPWTSPLLSSQSWLAHATSMREDGRLYYPDPHEPEDPYLPLRDAFVEGLGFDPSRLVVAGNVHGTRVVEAREGMPGRTCVPECDGLMTSVPGLPVGLRTADCLPIFIVDPVRRAVGVVHAGWKGVAHGMAAAGVEAFVERGCEPASLLVAIGPSIGPCHYDVHEGRREEILEASAHALGEDFEARNGKLFVDLRAIARRELMASGVLPGSIDSDPPCTVCDSSMFFSHHVSNEPHGRMLSMIAIRG